MPIVLPELSTITMEDTESKVVCNAKKEHIILSRDLFPKMSAYTAPKASFIAPQEFRASTGANHALANRF